MSQSTPAQSSKIDRTAERISRFRSLPHGWRFGEGVAPMEAVVKAALRLNEAAGVISGAETEAFAGASGSVQVTVLKDRDYVEFTVKSNGEITFVREIGDEEIEYEEGISLDQALGRIRAF